ncbi:hypothetical protein ACHAW5_009476 [Stephanodiscus triporus]|uniref:Uncharacterized protein n=1 Tax=Stephanodiscus triporus TaxID=2934178 RepID=A0ABD3QVM8_9STRA
MAYETNNFEVAEAGRPLHFVGLFHFATQYHRRHSFSILHRYWNGKFGVSSANSVARPGPARNWLPQLVLPSLTPLPMRAFTTGDQAIVWTT